MTRHFLHPRIPALIFGILVSGASSAASDSLASAIEAYDRGDYSSAAKLLTTFVANNKDNALGHYYLANTCLRLSETQKAKEEYENCVRLNSDRSITEYAKKALAKLKPAKSNSTPSAAALDAGITKEKNILIGRRKAEAETDIRAIRLQVKRDTSAVPTTLYYTSTFGIVPYFNPGYDGLVKALQEEAQGRIDEVNNRLKHEIEVIERTHKTPSELTTEQDQRAEISSSPTMQAAKAQEDERNIFTARRKAEAELDIKKIRQQLEADINQIPKSTAVGAAVAPNPDYPPAVQALQEEAQKRIDEVNSRLKHELDVINASHKASFGH